MRITQHTNIPDGTYFTATDVAPEILDGGEIAVYNGAGSRRSWGRPQVTSTVVVDTDEFAAIHVGFSHKHRGGQGWYYFDRKDDTTRRRRWAQLTDEQQALALDGYPTKAPGWAKTPGTPRAARAKPSDTERTAYKLVEVDAEGGLRGLYDPTVVYTVGKRLTEAVGPSAGVHDDWQDGGATKVVHAGGFYSYPDAHLLRQKWDDGTLVPARCYQAPKTIALIECRISGRIVAFPGGKQASTYLTPLEVVEVWQYAPQPEPSLV